MDIYRVHTVALFHHYICCGSHWWSYLIKVQMIKWNYELQRSCSCVWNNIYAPFIGTVKGNVSTIYCLVAQSQLINVSNDHRIMYSSSKELTVHVLQPMVSDVICKRSFKSLDLERQTNEWCAKRLRKCNIVVHISVEQNMNLESICYLLAWTQSLRCYFIPGTWLSETCCRWV